MTRSASNLFVCGVVLRTLFVCSPVVLAGLELCSFSFELIRSWFGLSGISVWIFDFLLLVCRVCFWIPFFTFVTAAGGSFFQFSYSSLQLVLHRIIHLRVFLHGIVTAPQAELFTDAQARNWFPLQRIRRGRQCTLWTRQYLSFAGARQLASVSAGQGGHLVAMPPPPWLAWWR